MLGTDDMNDTIFRGLGLRVISTTSAEDLLLDALLDLVGLLSLSGVLLGATGLATTVAEGGVLGVVDLFGVHF